ncbi:MAG: hypothetical protein U9Q15_00365 [Patescibacteria group bacterium]|nr:hypothetical protein [Patescibacteria group bacterium]
MSNFFSPMLSAEYWISPPGIHGDYYIIITGLFLGYLIAAFGLKLFKAFTENKLARKEIGTVISTLSTWGIIGLIFSFLRYENVAIFSARIWLIILVITSVVFIIRSRNKFKNNYQRRVKNAQRHTAK